MLTATHTAKAILIIFLNNFWKKRNRKTQRSREHVEAREPSRDINIIRTFRDGTQLCLRAMRQI